MAPTQVPLLSTTHAHLLAISFAFTYVGSLYLSKHTRLVFSSLPTRPTGSARRKEPDERWRDDPDVIRARLTAASLASVVCCVAVYLVIRTQTLTSAQRNLSSLKETLERLGIHSSGRQKLIKEDVLAHLVTPILFLGPLYARFLLEGLPFQKYWYWGEIYGTITSWQGIRNYIMAPLTEEVTFRACVIAVYSLCGASRSRIIFFSPLSFGLAHAHHAWDTYNRHGRTAAAAKRAALATTFQLAYTTLFGAYAAFLFLRTSSIFAPLSAHVFCNVMGVPSPIWEIQRLPKHKNAILTAYAAGLVCFMIYLGPWTRCSGLYWHA